MDKYDFQKIEKKWQEKWAEDGQKSGADFDSKPKHYHLVEFPYPSGAGLHVGHCMGYGASDAYCRMKRMQGYNVMFPIGWDAFGLPTENYAIKTGKKPAEVTKENTDNFRRQMKSLGLSFDWNREVNTTDPNYFRWTQWIFLQFYKHAVVDGKLIEVADDDKATPRLAYQAEMAINWCPSCKIGLANEEVIAGKCERCGAEVIKKMQKQWMLRITAYAERLIQDLDTVEYLDKIKTGQINWIGRSTGTNIKFKIKNSEEVIEVFTTRADTLYGCTYVVLAPEHPLVHELESKIKNLDEVKNYVEKSAKKSDLERTELQKDKTGVELKGIKAINPINGKEVSVWVADYVLASYGTGAVMAVPAHDERDWEFAKKYDIPIIEVIIPAVFDNENPPKDGFEDIERYAIQALVFDPKNDNKVLTLEWKDFPWTTFIVGGINEGETPEQAAAREIHEETGYKNIKFIKKLGGLVQSKFHATHKKENRTAYFQAMVFELVDDAQDDVSEEDINKYDIVWRNIKELSRANMCCSEADIWKNRLLAKNEEAFCDYGVLTNSEEFTGLTSGEAKNKITEKLKAENAGDFTVNYKLRDWVFSRQHYWGEPIPLIHCEKCGIVPVTDNELPIKLPDVEKYEPTDTGESPLAGIDSWVNVKCPKCGGNAKRETDTMPNWAGSSWYFLRYCDPNNDNTFADEKKMTYWMPVDLYNGGMEHNNLHLLYSRFWHKFLYDLKKVPTAEPYHKRIAHGIILGSDGRKMSKSFGNVINPDEIVGQFGADTTRAYIMFIGPYDQESAWSMAGVQGVYRFLTRVYNNFSKAKNDHKDSSSLLVKFSQTIKGLTDDLEGFRLNTVVSKLMELNNAIEKEGAISNDLYEKFILLLYPVAPHLASELWEMLEKDSDIVTEAWPKADEKYLIADEIEIAVSVNGKLRDKIRIAPNTPDEEVRKLAQDAPNAKKHTEDKNIVKIIVVPNKLVNIVVK